MRKRTTGAYGVITARTDTSASRHTAARSASLSDPIQSLNCAIPSR